jgi:hypothetical protein
LKGDGITQTTCRFMTVVETTENNGCSLRKQLSHSRRIDHAIPPKILCRGHGTSRAYELNGRMTDPKPTEQFI